jgi:uncharacterized protein
MIYLHYVKIIYMIKKIHILTVLVLMTIAGCNNDGDSQISSTLSSELSSDTTSIDVSSIPSSEQPSSESSSEEPTPAPSVSASIPEGYYDSIDEEISGDDLRAALYQIMIDTHTFTPTYDALKTHYKKTDADPENINNILMFYTGTPRKFTTDYSPGDLQINREHVWPQSKYGPNNARPGPYADLHHVRPIDGPLNSSRGNDDFGVVTGGTVARESGIDTDCLRGGGLFYPGPLYRGIVARNVFYVAMRYGPESSFNLQLVDRVTSTGEYSLGVISDLLAWNEEYPISDIEIRINEETFNIQGNRNPFIDHPELACRIWADYNANTQAACSII